MCWANEADKTQSSLEIRRPMSAPLPRPASFARSLGAVRALAMMLAADGLAGGFLFAAGLRWEKLAPISNGRRAAGDPGGRGPMMKRIIPLFFTATGLDGTNIYRNFILTSDDDGMTWAAPLDVTRTTKRPTRATTIASGPGTGIQLTRGPHAGRLLIPFNEGPYGKWQNYAVYSDDAGKSWPVKRVLYPGSFAYSVLTKFPDGTLGCLFEADGYGRIVFARFPLEWLAAHSAAISPAVATPAGHPRSS